MDRSALPAQQKRPRGLPSRLRENFVARRVVPAAAKAGTENKAFIAAVNRCATQKQDQNGVFPQAARPSLLILQS